jgi:hypothetical protein
VDAQREVGRRHDRSQARCDTDLLLLVYGLVGGVLIVSAGVLIADVERLWSPSTRAIALLATATATITAGVCADSILGWLRSSRAGR